MVEGGIMTRKRATRNWEVTGSRGTYGRKQDSQFDKMMKRKGWDSQRGIFWEEGGGEIEWISSSLGPPHFPSIQYIGTPEHVDLKCR